MKRMKVDLRDAIDEDEFYNKNHRATEDDFYKKSNKNLNRHIIDEMKTNLKNSKRQTYLNMNDSKF